MKIEELHKRVRKKLDDLENKEIGFVDWNKIEFETFDETYLSAKRTIKAINLFHQDMLMKIFNRRKIKQVKKITHF
jgi:hypothetical protein